MFFVISATVPLFFNRKEERGRKKLYIEISGVALTFNKLLYYIVIHIYIYIFVL